MKMIKDMLFEVFAEIMSFVPVLVFTQVMALATTCVLYVVAVAFLGRGPVGFWDIGAWSHLFWLFIAIFVNGQLKLEQQAAKKRP